MSEKPTVVEAISAVMDEVQAVRKGDRNQQQGSMRYVRAPFWHKAAVGELDECWPWLAGLVGSGYGTVGNKGLAHRVAYEMIVGPIPEGLTIDHLCRNRRCVNPLHMEVVTRAENGRRGEPNRANRGTGGGVRMSARTACKNGHEYVAGSYRMKGNTRICLPCARARRREFRERTGR